MKTQPLEKIILVLALISICGIGCDEKSSGLNQTASVTNGAETSRQSRQKLETDALEVVFRAHFTPSDYVRENNIKVYFLRINREDPSATLLERFREFELAVKPASDSSMEMGRVLDKTTRAYGVVYHIREITWISPEELDMESGRHAGSKSGSREKFYLQLGYS